FSPGPILIGVVLDDDKEIVYLKPLEKSSPDTTIVRLRRGLDYEEQLALLDPEGKHASRFVIDLPGEGRTAGERLQQLSDAVGEANAQADSRVLVPYLEGLNDDEAASALTPIRDALLAGEVSEKQRAAVTKALQSVLRDSFRAVDVDRWFERGGFPAVRREPPAAKLVAQAAPVPFNAAVKPAEEGSIAERFVDAFRLSLASENPASAVERLLSEVRAEVARRKPEDRERFIENQRLLAAGQRVARQAFDVGGESDLTQRMTFAPGSVVLDNRDGRLRVDLMMPMFARISEEARKNGARMQFVELVGGPSASDRPGITKVIVAEGTPVFEVLQKQNLVAENSVLIGSDGAGLGRIAQELGSATGASRKPSVVILGSEIEGVASVAPALGVAALTQRRSGESPIVLVAGSAAALGLLKSSAERQLFRLIEITRFNIFEKLRQLMSATRQTGASA
ncbi:MAG TPA: hypothetical protein VL404_04220, partial [Candidatus Eisenbacteria bacterium]|nr:hypothetical protein [Candidatus Eisenbacteria bacterium]